jgi:hypothetical protein
MEASPSLTVPAPGYEDALFRINGGDGDQTLFSAPLILQRVNAPWFNGYLGQRFGDAWLVRVAEGPRLGLLLGLTSHSLGEIGDDLETWRWKSVVVHGIDYPGYDPLAHGPRTRIGGMAALERLG